MEETYLDIFRTYEAEEIDKFNVFWYDTLST